jgi:uncharacterized protein (DUF2384 family)
LTQISNRTLDRRKQKGEFEPPEWERIYQFKELLEIATWIIGNEENAKKWLKKSRRCLSPFSSIRIKKAEVWQEKNGGKEVALHQIGSSQGRKNSG